MQPPMLLLFGIVAGILVGAEVPRDASGFEAPLQGKGLAWLVVVVTVVFYVQRLLRQRLAAKISTEVASIAAPRVVKFEVEHQRPPQTEKATLPTSFSWFACCCSCRADEAEDEVPLYDLGLHCQTEFGRTAAVSTSSTRGLQWFELIGSGAEHEGIDDKIDAFKSNLERDYPFVNTRDQALNCCGYLLKSRENESHALRIWKNQLVKHLVRWCVEGKHLGPLVDLIPAGFSELDDQCLLITCLLSHPKRKFCLDEGIASLQRHLKWIRRVRAWDIGSVPFTFNDELQESALRLLRGVDVHGRAIIQFYPGLHDKWKTSANQSLDLVCLVVAQALQRGDACVTGITFIYDFADASLLRMNMEVIGKSINIFLNAFPIRIGPVLVVNNPVWYGTFVKAMGSLLPAAVMEKVVIIGNDFVKLNKFIAHENLPAEYGGLELYNNAEFTMALEQSMSSPPFFSLVELWRNTPADRQVSQAHRKSHPMPIDDAAIGA